MADEGSRISVSEDKLYRALGELELRLVKSITDALSTKANEQDVIDLRRRVSVLEESRLARAHLELDVAKLEREFEESQTRYDQYLVVEADRRERSGLTWTRREKFMMVVLAAMTVLLQAANHWSF